MLYNTGALNYSNPQNQLVPDEGPKAIPLLIDFSGATTEWDVDLTNQQQQQYISMIQTLFIDASLSADDVFVTFPITGQKIQAKAGTQGYYNVLCPNPPRMMFTGTADTQVIPVFLINVPIAGVVWSV